MKASPQKSGSNIKRREWKYPSMENKSDFWKSISEYLNFYSAVLTNFWRLHPDVYVPTCSPYLSPASSLTLYRSRIICKGHFSLPKPNTSVLCLFVQSYLDFFSSFLPKIILSAWFSMAKSQESCRCQRIWKHLALASSWLWPLLDSSCSPGRWCMRVKQFGPFMEHVVSAPTATEDQINSNFLIILSKNSSFPKIG